MSEEYEGKPDLNGDVMPPEYWDAVRKAQVVSNEAIAKDGTHYPILAFYSDQEADWIKTREMSVKAIIQCFGITPPELGVVEENR